MEINCTDLGLDNTNCAKSLSAFIIGIIAGIFAWGWQVPQIIKAYKQKSLKEFSYKALGITLLGHSLMITYGTLIFQIPIMVNAPVAVCSTLTLITQKAIYERIRKKNLQKELNQEELNQKELNQDELNQKELNQEELNQKDLDELV